MLNAYVVYSAELDTPLRWYYPPGDPAAIKKRKRRARNKIAAKSRARNRA